MTLARIEGRNPPTRKESLRWHWFSLVGKCSARARSSPCLALFFPLALIYYQSNIINIPRFKFSPPLLIDKAFGMNEARLCSFSDNCVYFFM